jgi:ferredoxin
LTQPRPLDILAGMPSRLPAQIAVVDRLICDECGLCMPLCPPLAIHMRREGLLVDAAACTGCHKCIAPCPVGALVMVDNPAAERVPGIAAA